MAVALHYQKTGHYKKPSAFKKSHQNFPKPELKTVICKFYVQGYCKHGMYCTFAHGEDDLNTPVVPRPK